MKRKLMLLATIVIFLATAVNVEAQALGYEQSCWALNNFNYNDSLGFSNLSNITSLSNVTGKINSSVQFSSGSANSYLAKIPQYYNNANMSLVFWINAESTATTAGQGVVSNRGTGNIIDFELIYSNGSSNTGLNLLMRNAAGTQTTMTGATIGRSNSWTQVMIVRERNASQSTTANMYYYINNSLIAQSLNYPYTEMTSATTIAANTTFFGANPSSNPTNMRIDEVWYFNQTINSTTRDALWNSGNGRFCGDLTPFFITLIDGYNESQVSSFNATINFANGTNINQTTSTGTLTTNITKSLGIIANITINSNGYHVVSYSNWNTSTNLGAISTQIFLNITAVNALTGTSITNFNIITQYKNYTTTTGSVLANLTNGTAHNITITGAFVSQTTQVQYSSSPSNQTLQFSVYPVLAIRLFNESGATPFNTSITNGTTLFIYCENQTIQQGLTNTTTYLNSSCAWSIMRTYVTFGTETYYRTLKPTLDSTTIDFYLINLNTDTAVQKTFELNDLAGTYGQGDLIFDKIIGTTQVTINQDEWDIENKVISYFILNDQYIVELTDNSDNTRVLGPFIADATSNHVISVPTIPLYTDNTLDDFAWGYFFNAEDGWLYMNYASYNGTLYSVNFAIVNASNPSQVFYNNSFNTTNGSVNFTSIMNGSIYKTMLTFNHSSWSVRDDIKTWGGLFLQSDDFTGVDNIETWKLWFAIIIIIIGALIFNGLTTAAAAIWIAAMSGFFNWIGWLNIPPMWIIVIGVFALLVVFVGEGVK